MRAALLLAALALAAGCTPTDGGPRDRRSAPLGANPGKVIATERAFARMAREQGTWTAFRHYASKDAVWPEPRAASGLANVHAALKDRPDPAQPIVWGPDQAWSSCDGSFAVTTGEARYPDGRQSRFLTVWQRQEDGEYRWVLDQGFDSPGGATDPEAITARVAECPRPRSRPPARLRRGEDWSDNASDDGTLQWSTDITACGRTASVWIATPEPDRMNEVFRRSAPPSGPVPPGCAG